MLVGGYWLGIYVADPSIARHLPHGDSYTDGTDILAVAPGRTKAFYVNAVTLGADSLEAEYTNGHAWFWIDVLAADQ
jgi:regulatory protein YycH of two-component signal transduction system YycFG